MHLITTNPEWIWFNYWLNNHEDVCLSICVIWERFIVGMMIICRYGFSDERRRSEMMEAHPLKVSAAPFCLE